MGFAGTFLHGRRLLHPQPLGEARGRWTGRQRAVAAASTSVGVFFIKMLWEEVPSPAPVLVTAGMEAEALCQGGWKGVLAARMLMGALTHPALSLLAAHKGFRIQQERDGDPSSPPPPTSRGRALPFRQVQLLGSLVFM